MDSSAHIEYQIPPSVAKDLMRGPRKASALYFSIILFSSVAFIWIMIFPPSPLLELAGSTILPLIMASSALLIPFWRKLFQHKGTAYLCSEITRRMNQTPEFNKALYDVMIKAPWSKGQLGFGAKIMKTGILVFTPDLVPYAVIDTADNMASVRVRIIIDDYLAGRFIPAPQNRFQELSSAGQGYPSR